MSSIVVVVVTAVAALLVALTIVVIIVVVGNSSSSRVSVEPTNTLSEQNLSSLQHVTRVVIPGDPSYSDLRQGYNTRGQSFPLAIVRPLTEKDVQDVLEILVREKIPFCVRSRGHCFEPSFSSCDKVIIDLSGLTRLSVDQHNETVTAQPGVTIGRLKDELAQHGLALPTGTCPDVGVAGLSLGGGQGFLTRKYGVTSDSMLSARVLLANGHIVTADENQNSDLFFALRGAGNGSFGIVLLQTFRVHRIPTVVLYEIYWDRDIMKQVLDCWQRFFPFAVDDLSAELDIFSQPGSPVLVTGQYIGEESTLYRILQPFLDDVGRKSGGRPPQQYRVWTVPYKKAVDYFAGKHDLPHPFKNRSNFATEFLSTDALQLVERFLNNAPYSDTTSDKLEIDAFGGQVDRVGRRETAFPHREGTLFWMMYASNWDVPSQEPEKMKWVNEFHDSLQPFVSRQSYANCPDLQLIDWMHAYYGVNADKLVKIKRKYDKQNVFKFAQSIPLYKNRLKI